MGRAKHFLDAARTVSPHGARNASNASTTQTTEIAKGATRARSVDESARLLKIGCLGNVSPCALQAA